MKSSEAIQINSSVFGNILTYTIAPDTVLCY